MGGGVRPPRPGPLDAGVKHVSAASRSLLDYGQAQRLMMLINLITGASIWAVAGVLSTPLAEETSYGELISAVKAEWWAIPLTLGSAIHLLGQVVNGDPFFSPWVTPLWRLLGSIVCTGVMATFVAGSAYAAPELFVIIHFVQSFVVGIICCWFALLALGDLKEGLRMTRMGNER